MAEQQQGSALASTFPSPPPFYQHFTQENIDRIAALRAEAESDPNRKEASSRLLDLPPELRYLQPPEPPAEGIYRSFGDLYNVRFSSDQMMKMAMSWITDRTLPAERCSAFPRRARNRTTIYSALHTVQRRRRSRNPLRPRIDPQATRQVSPPELPRVNGHHERQPRAIRRDDPRSADVIHKFPPLVERI